MEAFRESILQLITQTSTNLPPDVRRAMISALDRETGGRSSQALNVIATNIDMATDKEGPICQDTGWPTFEDQYIHPPTWWQHTHVIIHNLKPAK